MPPSPRAAWNRSRAALAERFARIARCRSALVCARFAMAALRISRAHWFAVRHVRHDAIGYPIFPRKFSCRAALESSDIRVFVRSDRVWSLRFHRNRNSRAASTDHISNGSREELHATDRDRRTCTKLGLSAEPLAGVLKIVGRFCETPKCRTNHDGSRSRHWNFVIDSSFVIRISSFNLLVFIRG